MDLVDCSIVETLYCCKVKWARREEGDGAQGCNARRRVVSSRALQLMILASATGRFGSRDMGPGDLLPSSHSAPFHICVCVWTYVAHTLFAQSL